MKQAVVAVCPFRTPYMGAVLFAFAEYTGVSYGCYLAGGLTTNNFLCLFFSMFGKFCYDPCVFAFFVVR